MTWVTIDDAMPEHPKIIRLSDAAFRTHVAAICWCARRLTDGHVPDAMVVQLHPKAKRACKELLDAGLWTPSGDGYAIHDYLEYQEQGDIVKRRRELTKERVRKHRKRNAVTHDVTPDVTQDVRAVYADPQSQTQSLKPPVLKGQSQPQGRLTIKYDDGTPRTLAAQRLLDHIPNATDGTAGRLAEYLKTGATEHNFAEALQAIRSKRRRNPAAYACSVIERSMKEAAA